MNKALLVGTLTLLFVGAAVFTVGCSKRFWTGFCSTALTMPSPARHDYYVWRGLPDPYTGRSNPLKATIGNVVEGARLYDLRCATCHGMMGVGDGEAGEQLDLPPADLGRSLAEPLYRDDFFYWSIAEGGSRFATGMPPFKNDLKPKEIWRVITFMRAAFAETGSDPGTIDSAAEPLTPSPRK